jgi:hypothetical protein
MTATGRFNLVTVTAVALTFLVTTSVGLQRIFDTGDLAGDQRGACCIAVAGYFVLAELGKVLFRQLDNRRTA